MRGCFVAWKSVSSGRTLSSLRVPIPAERDLIRRIYPLTRGFHLESTEKRASYGTERSNEPNFTGDHEPRNHAKEEASRRPKDDTLTDSERAIFHQIYQDAVARNAQHNLSEEGRVELLIGDTDQNQHPNESLSTIFDRARDVIKRNQKTAHRPPGVLDADRRPEADPTRVPPELLQSVPIVRVPNTLTGPELSARLPSSVRESLQLALNQSALNLDPSRGGAKDSDLKENDDLVKLRERDAAIAKACSMDAIRVEALLEDARTDTEIWAVLQEEVFPQVEQFLEDMKRELESSGDAEGAGDGAASPRKKRGHVPKQVASELSSIRALSIATSPDKYPQLAQPFAIIRANYAHHCWAALRILRVKFPRSPYATTILPTIKSLGAISYVLGASAELYNELLFLRWAHYKDLQACADLLAEMLNRGIPTTVWTRAVFRDAARRWLAARKQLHAQHAAKRGAKKGTRAEAAADEHAAIPDTNESRDHVRPFELAWWSLEGVQSGFKRWEALEVEARRRTYEEKKRRERAMRDAEEDEKEGEDGAEKPTVAQRG